MSNIRTDLLFFFFLLLLHAFLYPFTSVPTLTRFGNAAQGMALLFAGIQFSRTARKAAGKAEHPFNFIALGFWICLMGHALLSYSELLLNKPATGTVTDAIWLSGYILIARSLLLMISDGLSRSAAVRLQIGLVVLAAGIVCTVLWTPLNDSERDLLTRAIQVIFPFLDFWIAAMAFVLARRTGVKGWLLGAFGSLIIGGADLVFPFFHQITSPIYRFLDIPLFVGYSLWWLTGANFASKKIENLT